MSDVFWGIIKGIILLIFWMIDMFILQIYIYI